MANYNSGSRASLSRMTKSFLVAQSLLIIALSTWLYKEYLNNQYLQSYLAVVFQGQGSALALLGLGGLLAVSFVGLLLKAGTIMGEIEHLSSKIGDQTGNVQTVESTSPMPVLEVVDPHSMDDIGRIHSSMRRWNDRSRHQDRS
jgi:hypothetical protein